MLAAGVAFHHASLTNVDRKAVENGYLEGDVTIICSTSTLAVGVNLPCYLVILKGTQAYTDTGLQEYSSLEVMQMLGRAGRPQFETEACAVILCLNERLQKYEKMVAGEEVLESSLHQNLIEHLNAEIGIGTINDVSSARQWLASTFLNVRLQRNPKYYDLDSEEDSNGSDDALLKWCEKDLNLLLDAELIEDNGFLRCTEYGDAMARYCVKFETIKAFMAVPPKAKVPEVLNTLSQAAEFRDFRLKQGEKTMFKDINQANETRYPIKVDIALTPHKVSLLIQARLGCVPLNKNDKKKISGPQLRQLALDTNGALSHARRLIRCMIDIFIHRNDSIAARSALELARSIAAGVWDDTVMQVKQLAGIGDVYMRKLAAANIKTIDQIFNTESHRLEVILSKNPPFGLDLHKKAAEFPMLHVSVKEEGKRQKLQQGAEIKIRSKIGFLNQKIPLTYNRRQYSVLFLCETTYGELVDFRRFGPSRLKDDEEILLTALVKEPGASLRCHVMCDDLAGTHRFAELAVECPISWYPVKPQTSQTAFQRPNLISNAPVREADEEFDVGLDDADLLQAVQKPSPEIQCDDIDDILDESKVKENNKKHKRKRSESVVSDTERTWREPKMLPNGHWTCQHSCADEGKECKHKCCVEGVKKKPKKPMHKRTKNGSEYDENVVNNEVRPKDVMAAKQQQSRRHGPLDKLLPKVREAQPLYHVGESARSKIERHRAGDNSAASNKNDTLMPAVVGTISGHTTNSRPDSFDFSDFDWPADPVEKESTSHIGLPARESTRNTQPSRPMRTLNLAQNTSLKEAQKLRSSENGLFLAQNSSPTKYDDHGLFDVNDDFEPPKEVSDHTSPAKAPSFYGTPSSLRPTTKIDSTSSTEILHPMDQNSHTRNAVRQKENEEEQRKRLFVEDQKRKWAELNHPYLNYENFGKWNIVITN